ncbi:hypothetical protein BD769DRAFT_1051010 [Suillus cothurnatus]|nr:hypothetical protein BD769DRAFT_1051010 [Suillus cothurnatus]
MSGLSVLVCGTMSVWCLAFMTRLPLVRNLSPYGNGFALLKALCPSHFRVYVVHSSLFYVENSMDHTDPSLETAHSCYSWTYSTAASQSGKWRLPDVLATKAQALFI